MSVQPSRWSGAEPTLSVSDVAREADVNASAVRFYDKHGLITGVRTSGNQRRFSAMDICRVKIAKVAQRIGMTVSEISVLLETLPRDREATLDDWERLNDGLVQEGRRRMLELQRAMDDIAAPGKLCEVSPD